MSQVEVLQTIYRYLVAEGVLKKAAASKDQFFFSGRRQGKYYIYNLCDIWRVKLAITRYLPTSFARRLLRGRRIHRFISSSELCLQLGNLASYI